MPLNSDDAAWLPTTWSPDYSYDHHPAIEMAWLVSGNEGEKLALLNNRNIVKEFIEVPDGRQIADDNTRVCLRCRSREYLAGPNKNAWADHQKFVGTKISHYHHPLLELPDPDQNDTVAWVLKFDSNKTIIDQYGVKAPKTPLFLKANSETGKSARAHMLIGLEMRELKRKLTSKNLMRQFRSLNNPGFLLLLLPILIMVVLS